VNASRPSHLEEIVAATRSSLERRKTQTEYDQLYDRAMRRQPRGFAAALRKKAEHGPAIIAELKKASPSRGLIRANFDVASLAPMMVDSGAAALSVLTESQYFQGSLEYLQVASAAVVAPCLRKDFIVDTFQLVEARAYGADAVLLIAAVLSNPDLKDLRHFARSMELDVLCEVHDEEELVRVLDLGCEMIGVNNRNLKTFHVDLGVAERLASSLPRECVRVAESGITNIEDIERLQHCGYEGFLIGESLMKCQDPGAALRRLLTSASASV